VFLLFVVQDSAKCPVALWTEEDGDYEASSFTFALSGGWFTISFFLAV
jgi:hypothetical protein